MDNSEEQSISTYLILIMSIVFHTIGMSGLFLLFSQFLVSHYPIHSSFSFIPKIFKNENQERQKNSTIKRFWIPILFTSYPLMIFVIPLFLIPLLLTGFVLMMLLGPSLAIFLTTRRIFKEMNLKGLAIYKSYIQSTNIKNILLGFVLGFVFYGIMILSLGKINGLVPNIEKLKWIPIYFIATLFCFLNVMFYFQTVREESAVITLESPNVKILIQNTVHDFMRYFGIVAMLFSIPSLLIHQTMILMLLVPLSLIIFTASFFANYYCSKNKDVWIPAIIISIVTSIFLSILSPIIELSIF